MNVPYRAYYAVPNQDPRRSLSSGQTSETPLAQHRQNRYGDVTASGSAQLHLGDYVVHNHVYAGERRHEYDMLLASLTFDQMDSRLRNVEPALNSTCQWLFNHRQFLAWTAVSTDPEYQPFLWIKGKPGSGKSTIMKEMHAWMVNAWSRDTLVLAYFFNARSPDDLEKSSLGLYRALLHQIMVNCPRTREAFVKRFAIKISTAGIVASWSLGELKTFYFELFKNALLPPLIVLIDALDEGNEDDVRELIQHLSRLQQCAANNDHSFRIAFSSRHYPSITIDRSLSLIVEDTPEHDEDIDIYIRSELTHFRGHGLENLKRQVRLRSAGVFLWVVLVIASLKKSYDRGKKLHEIVQKLDELPSNLHDMFSQILLRDAEDFDKCLKLLAWVLYSEIPLTPMELYCALEQPYPSPDSTITFAREAQGIERSLLHYSRGLVEVIHGQLPLVQFIHETVRDFLTGKTFYGRSSMQPESTSSLFLAFEPRSCHINIAKDCLRYLHGLRAAQPAEKWLMHFYPLSGYAANAWWRHVRRSGAHCDEQFVSMIFELFATPDPVSDWIQACGIWLDLRRPIFNCVRADVLEHPWLSFLSPTGKAAHLGGRLASPLYLAASVGIYELAREAFNRGANVYVRAREDCPLEVAVYFNHCDIVKLLLDNITAVNFDVEMFDGARQIATDLGYIEIEGMLLDKVDSIDPRVDEDERLCAPSMEGDVERVRLLLSEGSDVNARDAYCGTALHAASSFGHVAVVELLLSKGADVNARTVRLGAALHIVSQSNRPDLAKMLLDRGANVNIRKNDGSTALHEASFMGNFEMVRLLLDRGADIDISDKRRDTALLHAVRQGNARTTKLILEHRAAQDVVVENGDARNAAGLDALVVASMNGNERIVALLLKHGVDPKQKTRSGLSALQVALSYEHANIIRLLLRHGVNKDMISKADMKRYQFDSMQRSSANDESSVPGLRCLLPDHSSSTHIRGQADTHITSQSSTVQNEINQPTVTSIPFERSSEDEGGRPLKRRRRKL